MTAGITESRPRSQTLYVPIICWLQCRGAHRCPQQQDLAGLWSVLPRCNARKSCKPSACCILEPCVMVRVFWPQPQSAGVLCSERTSHKVLFVCMCVCRCAGSQMNLFLSHCNWADYQISSLARCLTSRVNLCTAVRVTVKGNVFACVWCVWLTIRLMLWGPFFSCIVNKLKKTQQFFLLLYSLTVLGNTWFNLTVLLFSWW